ncbi:MAG: TRAP transporter small permease subunit [Acetobacteraceae bacterium]
MKAIGRISTCALWFGGGLILLAAVIIGIDVLLRKFLETSLGGADELAGYALAIGSAWALPAALLDRGHIRIDSLYVHFGLRARLLLDLLGLGLFMLFFALLAWHAWGIAEQSFAVGARSQNALETPIAIPQAIWAVGLTWFVLVGLLVGARAIQLGLAGDASAAVRLVGTRSAEEEVEEEVRNLKLRAESVT